MQSDPELGLALIKMADTKAQRDQSYGLEKRKVDLAERTATAAARGFDYREVEGPDGTKQLVRINRATGDITRPPIAGAPTTPNNPFAGGSMKEHESKEALFSDRAASAHETINKFENYYQGAGGKAAGLAEKILPETAFNLIAPGEQQRLMNAKRSFVNALLRRESGAAINVGEFSSYDREYFPQPGDDQPTIEQKRLHRAEVVSGLARGAGPRYTPKFELDDKGGIKKREMNKPAAPVGSGTRRPQPNEAAIRYLEQNPQTRDQFDALFGAGMSKVILGP
jgi:hypothetical protein